MHFPSDRHATSSVNDPFKPETLSAHKQEQLSVRLMKIESGRPVGAASTTKKAGQAAAPGFTVAAEAPAKTTAATSVGGVTALDAILALQSDEPPAQRRARQTKRGRDALDAQALGDSTRTVKASDSRVSGGDTLPFVAKLKAE